MHIDDTHHCFTNMGVEQALKGVDPSPVPLNKSTLQELVQNGQVKPLCVDPPSRDGVRREYSGTLILLYDERDGRHRWIQVRGVITYPEELPRLMHPLNELGIDQVYNDAMGG